MDILVQNKSFSELLSLEPRTNFSVSKAFEFKGFYSWNYFQIQAFMKGFMKVITIWREKVINWNINHKKTGASNFLWVLKKTLYLFLKCLISEYHPDQHFSYSLSICLTLLCITEVPHRDFPSKLNFHLEPSSLCSADSL